MSQFPVNCSNFTAHQSRVLNLTRSVTASVCLVVILLIIVLLFFYRAYESTLQRLFFYLSTVTLIYEIANVLQMEHLWQYHQQKKLCAYLGFCDQWTVAMVYLSTIQINIFLMYKVYEQFRGALCPSISHSQRCRIVLEICSVLCVVLIPCAYLWKPLLDGNFGIAGAWCWMRTLDEDCVSVGFLDQVFSPMSYAEWLTCSTWYPFCSLLQYSINWLETTGGATPASEHGDKNPALDGIPSRVFRFRRFWNYSPSVDRSGSQTRTLLTLGGVRYGPTDIQAGVPSGLPVVPLLHKEVQSRGYRKGCEQVEVLLPLLWMLQESLS